MTAREQTTEWGDTIREQLNCEAADAALAALLAEVEQLREREADQRRGAEYECARADAAEAALKRLGPETREAIAAAEAEVEQQTAALREIASINPWDGHKAIHMQNIALAALRAGAEPGENT